LRRHESKTIFIFEWSELLCIEGVCPTQSLVEINATMF
jgi:hypothetical protein